MAGRPRRQARRARQARQNPWTQHAGPFTLAQFKAYLDPRGPTASGARAVWTWASPRQIEEEWTDLILWIQSLEYPPGPYSRSNVYYVGELRGLNPNTGDEDPRPEYRVRKQDNKFVIERYFPGPGVSWFRALPRDFPMLKTKSYVKDDRRNRCHRCGEPLGDMGTDHAGLTHIVGGSRCLPFTPAERARRTRQNPAKRGSRGGRGAVILDPEAMLHDSWVPGPTGLPRPDFVEWEIVVHFPDRAGKQGLGRACAAEFLATDASLADSWAGRSQLYQRVRRYLRMMYPRERVVIKNVLSGRRFSTSWFDHDG